ncbi:MAG: bifunctional shikimate kinase/3-dehydroquinate synthase [Gaiellaceae bacterium]
MVRNALSRHLVLVGFMGAGKSTLGPVLAQRLRRPFVSIDEVVEQRAGSSVAELFAARGESAFRELEEQAALDLLAQRELSVIELGGGGLGSAATRAVLHTSAFMLHLETTPEEAWDRVSSSGRPLARDRDAFYVLFDERRALYEAANGSARDLDGAVLAAAGVHVSNGALERLGELVPGSGDIELVADEHVDSLYGDSVRAALGARVVGSHVVPAGELAKRALEAERLWSALRVGRSGTIVVLGGGCTIDVGGFVAATYLRGVAWISVPTTLLAQVDAGIGGKTAIDVPEGKNLVGAFHWPARTVVDPDVLSTLPQSELENGRSEVVKTGLLAGEPFWELATFEQVRRCAAFKSAVCLRDPHDRGARAQLNLGHTFAHALEAASGYSLAHGHAVALGLLAALRVSGLEDDARQVEEILKPPLAHVDREVAWTALARDKKAAGGRPALVLLDAPGKPRLGIEVEPQVVRAALDSLIA